METKGDLMATSTVGMQDPRAGMIVAPATSPYGDYTGRSVTRDRGGERIGGSRVLKKYKSLFDASGPEMTAALSGAWGKLGLDPKLLDEYKRIAEVQRTNSEKNSEEDKTAVPVMSPALSAAIKQIDAKYQPVYLGAGTKEAGSTRRLAIVDRSTGQVASSGDTYSKESWYKAPAQAAAVLGGTYLAALGAAGAGAGAGAGTGATTGGMSGLELGALADSAAAGAGTVGAGGSWVPAAGSAAGSTGAASAGLGSLSESALLPSAGQGSALATGTTPALQTAQVGSMSQIPTAAGGGGWLSQAGSTLSSKWDSLTPQQKLQLGGQLGSAVAGGISGATGGGSSVGGGMGGNYDQQFNSILSEMLTSQRTNNAFSNDLMAQYRNTYMPAQQRMADTAANYDTAGRREAAGAEAVAGVDLQFQRQREGLNRDLGRAGISLDSGRALTLDNANRFGAAKASAGADRVARQGVEDRGIALTQGVVQQGNQVGSLGLNASQVGNSAGYQAGNTLQGQLQAQDAANRTRLGLDSARNNDRAADAAGWGSLLGTLGGLYFGGAKP